MASLLDHYGWHEWLCHTNFSFLYGASHPDELVARAASLGYRGLAITDMDGVYGLSRSYQAWKKIATPTVEGVASPGPMSLFYGAEIHLQKDHALPLLQQNTLVLIAKSHRGYFNLCRLLSYAHRGGKHDADVPLEHLLSCDVTDIAAIKPMRGGTEACSALSEHFRGRFYFAIGRFLTPAEDYRIPQTIALAQRLGAPCLLTQDVFFATAEEKDLNDLLHAIRLNKTLATASSHLFANGEHRLHDLKNLHARFEHLSVYRDALMASRELAESCQFSFSELRYHYPKEMIPPHLTAQQYLEQLTWESARSRYSGVIPAKTAALLEHELRLIAHLGFADYFLTVWDIVHWARTQDILCQGRGSAANSAICYVLGITAVDPALFDLLFERFISVERGDPPDIDVDFEHERREEVIQYIYRRYGRDRAAMVANVITFRSRGAIRAVGKALGIPEVALDKAAKILEVRSFRHAGPQSTMSELQSILAEDGVELNAPVPWDLWAQMAERLKGFPRHLGIHSGGFILADKPLDWLVAQEPATMENRSVVQWCKEDIEALGFFKIDILALGILTAVRKCLSMIGTHYGQTLTLASIPADDRPTYAMIQRADTVGTFQIESRAQMSMLPRLRPRNFYDLVIEVAIIRPGPIQGKMIHPFLRRRNGQEAVTFEDPRLKPILERTLGIPIFQEQVMRIAMAVGDFTAGEANELRKNLGAFAIKGDISKWIAKLQTGMKANGLSQSFIDGMMGQLAGFAHYGFPESHAASFALLAYASSYLKCHYPAAFFTSLLNSQPMGFYSLHVLVQTARHCGVEVRPICVQHSDWEATLEAGAEDAKGKSHPAIRLGLHMVRSLREETAKAFVARRREESQKTRSIDRDHPHTWPTLVDFLSAAHLSRVDLTALATANALAIYGIDRRAAIWLAEAAPFCDFLEDVESPVLFREETAMESIEADFHATSTSLGRHPVEILREDLWCYEVPTSKVLRAKEILEARTNQTVIVFGMIIVRQAPPSANGMVFATIEDETGLINLAITPQIYPRVRKVFDRQSFICVLGQLQRQDGAHSILVNRVFEPTVIEAEVIPIMGAAGQGNAGKKMPARAPLHEQELAPSRNYS